MILFLLCIFYVKIGATAINSSELCLVTSSGTTCLDQECLGVNFKQASIERRYLLFYAVKNTKASLSRLVEQEVEERDDGKYHDTVEYLLERQFNFTKLSKNIQTLKKIELPQDKEGKKYSLLWVRVTLAKAEKSDLPASLFMYAIERDTRSTEFPSSSEGILWINRFPNSAIEINRKDKIAIHMQHHASLFVSSFLILLTMKNYTAVHPFTFLLTQQESFLSLKNNLLNDRDQNKLKWIVKPVYGGATTLSSNFV